MFKKLLEELRGWTIEDWDEKSDFPKSTRLVVSKDNKEKIIYLGNDESSFGIHRVYYCAADSPREICTNLDEMAQDISEHWLAHDKDPKYRTINESKYLGEIINFWFTDHLQIRGIIQFASKNQQHVVNLVAIADDALSAKTGLFFTSYANIFPLPILLVYITPGEYDDLINNKILLPEELEPENWDFTTIIKSWDNYHYQSPETELENRKKLIITTVDARRLQIGFMCQKCSKEWWTNLYDIKLSDSSIREMLKTEEGREKIAQGKWKEICDGEVQEDSNTDCKCNH